MTRNFFASKRLLFAPVALILADALVAIPSLPAEWRFVGAAILFFFLPGWVLLETFSPQPAEPAFRALVAAGISYAVSLLGSLYLVYLPGVISLNTLLVSANIWIVLGIGAAWARRINLPPLTISRRELLIALALLGLALLVRLPLAGYSEFHEDEVEVVSFAARVIGGEEYALFLHRKGPAQTLAVLLAWAGTHSAAELPARLPFLLASALGVLAVYYLARETIGRPAALAAGILLAFNGLSVAFGRMVQYQALILFLGPLALWMLWQARQKQAYGWIPAGAVLLAVCTLAHYDTFLYYPAALYLAWQIGRTAVNRRAALAWLAAGGLLALVILASFYVPYVRDPQFQHTLAYLTQDRIGDRPLDNNLKLLWQIDSTYNSWLSLPLLFGLAIAATFHAWKDRSGWIKIGWLVLLALAASTYPLRDVWKTDLINLSILPWLALMIWGGWQFSAGWGIIWVWWLSALAGYVFAVDKPFTHFYIAYPAWVIVAGMGAQFLYQKCPILWQQAQRRPVRWMPAVTGLALAIFLFGYQTILFWHTDSAYRRDFVDGWAQNSLYPLYRFVPPSYGYFGAPRQIGWKAVGALLESGALTGDYRTANELFSVPVWYAYQRPRSCYDDPALYFVADLPSENPVTLPPDYTRAAAVLVEGSPRIAVYAQNALNLPAPQIDLAEYAPQFDAAATPARFSALPAPPSPLDYRFGESIRLRGFSLSAQNRCARPNAGGDAVLAIAGGPADCLPRVCAS